MDDREPLESNVVRLQRDGEPDEEERQRLARTIFASEDEVGTFSRGNLLLPSPTPPPHEESPAEPDPFFDQLQSPDQSATPSVLRRDRAETVAYFEKLGSQTAAEMSADATAAQPNAVSLPGSARLPAELDKRRRRGPRLHRAVASDPQDREPRAARRGSRLAAAPVAAALGVLVVSGAALAAIVAGGGHSGAPRSQVTTHGSNPAAALAALWPSITGPNSRQTATSRRRAVGRHPSTTQQRRHLRARRRVKRASKRPVTPVASSSAAVSTAPVSPTQPVQSTPAPQESASAASSSSSTSGTSGGGGASSSHQPVWGANGILGPGHSPNG